MSGCLRNGKKVSPHFVLGLGSKQRPRNTKEASQPRRKLSFFMGAWFGGIGSRERRESAKATRRKRGISSLTTLGRPKSGGGGRNCAVACVLGKSWEDRG